MGDLLKALGWQPRVADGLRLIALIGGLTGAILVAAFGVREVTDVPLILLQALVWGAWLVWLGVVFPRNGRRDAESACAYPYRRAFFREILLGISVAFSQFLRPLGAALVEGGQSLHSGALAIGVPMLLVGAGMIFAGVSALGVARTLFVHEYGDRCDWHADVIVRSGIYRFVRHPLFMGGCLVSLGLATCTGSDGAVALGLLNMLVYPVYVRLEDQRCIAVLGRDYVDYADAVGGLIPRRRSSIEPAAQLREVAGSITPITGRVRVSRR